ncbi:MAG: bifunctional (p)ppGpp synthetase/guanosine-3',5'-bis(diphosphate) 3'-pyrophosphohydrolase [Clostridia bacterium]|nr:bifunctional (p)ppGpp synthetase/guanosine-3',5'-bis(diphosphate) 3'-pyrophosphohydrolase [Clostridia bacterium]
MFYSDKVKKAIKIAYEAHAGQVDNAGYPYFLHPYHLAEQMSDEDSTVVALLHDVVEDTSVTLDDLRREGFGEEILAALALLTHVKGVPYADYVAKIKDNPLARRVKIADLKHNCEVKRGADTRHFRRKREECYYPALRMLLAAEGSFRGSAALSDLPAEAEIGKEAFLIQDDRLKSPSFPLVKMLREDGFREWSLGTSPRVKSFLYVNLNTKTYSYGRNGLPVTGIIGGKAISADEFLQLYKIYRPTDRHALFLVFAVELERDEETGVWSPIGKAFLYNEYEPAVTSFEAAVGCENAATTCDLSLLKGVEVPPDAEDYVICYDEERSMDALYYALRFHPYVPLKGEKDLYYLEVYSTRRPGIYTVGAPHRASIAVEDGWNGDLEDFLKRYWRINGEDDYLLSRDLPKGVTSARIPSDDYLVLTFRNAIIHQLSDDDDAPILQDSYRIYYTKPVE